MRAERFPLGAGVTVGDLEGDPHDLLARLRTREPVSWLPAVDGWLVTRRDLALAAMRDAATLHRRRPALHDRAGGGGEHAVARRRGARPAPRAVRRAAAARARCAAGWRPRSRRRRRGSPTSSRRPARPSCGAASRARWRPLRSRTRWGSTGRATGAVLGLVRRDRRRRHRPQRGPAGGARGGAGGRGARRGGAPRRRSGLSDARGHVQRRRAAVRRHRDDRGHDRQRGAAPALASGGSWPRCAPTRRCCRPRSRSRCGSSRPRR